MSTFCGLDFGTSNSTIGINDHGLRLIPLENNKPTIRSAIFCDAELKQWIFGQAGINHYLSGTPGRLMMALKSVLGSSLMQDETLIFNEFIPYSKVLANFLQYIKRQAEQLTHKELTQVVMGRPVHFDDQDLERDRLAQQTLADIAQQVGFKDIHFQFEPIAAALAYETSIHREQLALIVDMGGGTSDFTVIRLRPGYKHADRTNDVLANAGIHIAGTDFDHKLSLHSVMPMLGMGSLMRGSSSDIEVPSMYYHDLTTWHTLSGLYSATNLAHIRKIQAMAHDKQLLGRLLTVLQQRAGHHILDSVETSKQQLSTVTSTKLNLEFIEDQLMIDINRINFNSIIQDQVQSILTTIDETIRIANVNNKDISAIFYTGGTTQIPMIREQINCLFPNAEIVQGDAFGSVGMGLTIDAERRFGP